MALISGFRRDVDKIYALLGYYAASCGNCLPTFRCPERNTPVERRFQVLVGLLKLTHVIVVEHCCFRYRNYSLAPTPAALLEVWSGDEITNLKIFLICCFESSLLTCRQVLVFCILLPVGAVAQC